MNPIVTIITPVFNGESLIEDTLASVMRQTYRNIQYIIVDGNSSDLTLDVISRYSEIVDIVISEKDDGMYDALAKGLKLAKGEIICYINAGDLFYEHAIETVVEVFESNRDLQWITGLRSVSNDKNQIIKVEIPFRYRGSFIKKGVYGLLLPYIQQESTFWRKSLSSFLNYKILKSKKLAGDYYLWYTFSHYANLEVVNSPLGIFKKHQGQISEDLASYKNEVRSFSERISVLDFFGIVLEAVVWLLDYRIRQLIFRNVYTFNFNSEKWMKGKRPDK